MPSKTTVVATTATVAGLVAATYLWTAQPLPAGAPGAPASTDDPHLVVRAVTPSVYCKGCHDGTVAAAVDVGSHTHPVDVAMPAARPDDYATELPAELVLDAERRVTCSTCHDTGVAGFPHRLARPLSRSAICLDCHRR